MNHVYGNENQLTVVAKPARGPHMNFDCIYHLLRIRGLYWMMITQRIKDR